MSGEGEYPEKLSAQFEVLFDVFGTVKPFQVRIDGKNTFVGKERVNEYGTLLGHFAADGTIFFRRLVELYFATNYFAVKDKRGNIRVDFLDKDDRLLGYFKASDGMDDNGFRASGDGRWEAR